MVSFAHSCSFCGWGRASSSPVMLSPSCGRCGCALDARARAGGDEEQAAAVSMPPRAIRALRCLGVLLAVLALYAATDVGYRSAGPAGALIAFGLGVFLAVPFVPQRLGARAS